MRHLVACIALLAGCSGVPGSGDDSTGDDTPPTDASPPVDAPVQGIIHPDRDNVASATDEFYATWKATYLEPACTTGQWRIRTGSPAYTVSEGHGYAMLATALFDDREIFDGLLAYYRAHPSTVNPALMAWAQDESCADVQGADSATDGDLDIAYALLLADARWGGYAADARRIIDAILAGEVTPANTVLIGDWANNPMDTHYNGTRTSDLMPQHFRAFAKATDVEQWRAVLDKTYAIVSTLQEVHAPSTGLLPDFAIDATGDNPAPAPSRWLEGQHDGEYSWNACRTPWRIATDAVVTGEDRSRDAARRLTAWVRTATGEDPGNIRGGYALDGNALVNYSELAFIAPFVVAAMVEPVDGTNQPWLDTLWDHVVAEPPNGYYGDSIKLLSMAVVAGRWQTP